MIPDDSSESHWWTRLSNFQNQSLRFYSIKLIPHMILKILSTSRLFWIDYKYEKSLILQNSSSERPLDSTFTWCDYWLSFGARAVPHIRYNICPLLSRICTPEICATVAPNAVQESFDYKNVRKSTFSSTAGRQINNKAFIVRLYIS